MPNVSYYLKHSPNKNQPQLIYLNCRFGEDCRLALSTGEKVLAKDWNKKKQRVKRNDATTGDGKHSLNALLDKLDKILNKAYNEYIEREGKKPTPEELKAELHAFLHPEHHKKIGLFELLEMFYTGKVLNRGKEKSGNTLKGYRTLYGHLQQYQTAIKKPLTFDSIDFTFFDSFVTLLRDGGLKVRTSDKKGLSQNTISKSVSLLKTVLAEAVTRKLTSNTTFKHRNFSVPEVETDSVALTESEILKLYRHDFSSHRRLEQVRDLFVVGCYTGLRFSDYSTVKAENFFQDAEGRTMLKIFARKTREFSIIPCHPVVLEIRQKYAHNENGLPLSYSAQKFNDFVKIVCCEAGLREKGRLSTDLTKELWECVSSHTCRRSFCTNMYMQKVSTYDIMKISGHRTESSFRKYIKVDKLQAAIRLHEHMQQRSEQILRAV